MKTRSGEHERLYIFAHYDGEVVGEFAEDVRNFESQTILDKAAAQQISVSVEMAARYDLAFLRNDQLAAKPRTLDEIMVRLPNGQTELSRGRVKNAGPTFSQLADLAIKADIKGFAA